MFTIIFEENKIEYLPHNKIKWKKALANKKIIKNVNL